MKKKYNLVAFFMTLVILTSCSSNEEVSDEQNKLTINGKHYSVKSLAIERDFDRDGNRIFHLHMFNVTEQDFETALETETIINDLNVFSITLKSGNLVSGTYRGLNELDYAFMVDGTWLGEYGDEQLLMKGANGDETELIIHSVDEDNSISLEFEFKRSDGTTAVGTYEGKYFDMSSVLSSVLD